MPGYDVGNVCKFNQMLKQMATTGQRLIFDICMALHTVINNAAFVAIIQSFEYDKVLVGCRSNLNVCNFISSQVVNNNEAPVGRRHKGGSMA